MNDWLPFLKGYLLHSINTDLIIFIYLLQAFSFQALLVEFFKRLNWWLARRSFHFFKVVKDINDVEMIQFCFIVSKFSYLVMNNFLAMLLKSFIDFARFDNEVLFEVVTEEFFKVTLLIAFTLFLFD